MKFFVDSADIDAIADLRQPAWLMVSPPTRRWLPNPAEILRN